MEEKKKGGNESKEEEEMTRWRREKRKKSYANLLITLTKKVRVKLIVKNCLRLLFGKEQNGSRWGAICKKYLKTGRGISNYSQINGFELCYHWEKRQNEWKRGRERVLKLWSCRTLILVFSIWSIKLSVARLSPLANVSASLL